MKKRYSYFVCKSLFIHDKHTEDGRRWEMHAEKDGETIFIEEHYTKAEAVKSGKGWAENCNRQAAEESGVRP